MNAKTFLTVQALVSVVFAVSMIFMSQQMTDRYMMDSNWENPATALIRKGMGSLLIGIAIGNWFARNASPSPALKGWIISSVVGNLLIAIFHIQAITNQTEKSFAWVSTAVCLVFAAWGALVLTKQDK
ncbi:MAG: hypothetical protein RL131_526 [Bacteroidota bacterium]|jgi:hypothetical protein